MKKFSLVVLVALFAVILSGCVLIPESKQSAGIISDKQGLMGEPESLDRSDTFVPIKTNFSKRGVILNWDSRTESYTKEWTFLYDEPGALALNVKLIFNEKSICNLGKIDMKCDPSKLTNGTVTSVEGFEDKGKLLVTKLNYSPGYP